MSKTVDEKVVALKFNKKQFEAGVDSSLKKIDDLNKGLKLEGASKNLEKVAKTAGEMDMSKMEVSIDKVSAKIGFLNQIAVTFVERMTNGLIDMGKNIADTFAIRPVTTGFQEYELKMNSVQTIMASTGASIDTVSNYLEELNKYADQTSYSFSDMTESIGKFTNAGVSLDMAVAAIKGISNEAAVSGANANEASRAMYNFAQALSAGSVKLIDWKSIENANMATVEFKNELLKTAAEIGTVTQDAAGMYKVLTSNASGSAMKETIDATHNFNDSLSYQWMTTDVLIKTLQRYADETTDIGKKAYAAAQEAKTFSDMIGILEETAQSGWGETWELVVGDLEQAKALWTEWSNFFGEIIQAGSDARNELIGNAMRLQDADGITGRVALWEGVKNVLESLVSTLGAAKKGFEDVFPPLTDQQLRLAIEKFKQFSEVLKNDEERLDKIRRTFRGIFAVLDIFVTTIRFAFRVATSVVQKFATVIGIAFFALYNTISEVGSKVNESSSGFYKWLYNIKIGIKDFIAYVKELEGGLTISNILKGLSNFGKNVLGKIFDLDGLISVWKAFLNTMSKIFSGFANVLTNLSGPIGDSFKYIIQIFTTSLSRLGQVISWATKTFGPRSILLVVIAALLLKLLFIFKSFTEPFTGVVDNLKEMLSNVNSILKNFALELKSEAMLNFAKSIAVLVAAMILLSGFDTATLIKSLGVIVALSVTMAGLTIALSKFSGSIKNSISAVGLLLAFSMALSTVTKSFIKLESSIDNNGNITKSLAVLGALASGLVIVGKILQSNAKTYMPSVMSMLSFVASLNILVNTVNKINQNGIDISLNTLKVLATITTVLIVISKSFSKISVGSGLGALAIVASIKIIINIIEKLSEFKSSSMGTAITNFSKLLVSFSVIAGIIIGISAIISRIESKTKSNSKKNSSVSKNVQSLGNLILKLAASTVIIGAGIKVINSCSVSDLNKSMSVITKLFAIFGAITVVSAISGSNANKAGSMISKMSKSILAIGALVAIFSLWKDPETLKKPLRMIEELLLVMTAMIALTHFAGDENVSKSISSLTIAASSIGLLVAVFTQIDSANLIPAVLAMTAILGMISMLIASTSMSKKASSTIKSLTVAVAMLSGVIIALSLIDVQSGIQGAAYLGLLFLGLMASFKLLESSKSMTKGDIAKSILMLAAAVGSVAAIALVLDHLDVESSISTAASIGILMLSIGASFNLLSKSATISADVGKQVGLMSLSIIAIGAVLGILSALNIEASYKNALVLGLTLAEIVLAFKILSEKDAIGTDVAIQIDILSAAMVPLAAALKIMNRIDPDGANKKAVSLGLLLGSVVVAMKILNDQSVINWIVIGQLAIIEALVGGIALIISMMSGIESNQALSIAGSLSMVLLSMAATAGIASAIGIVAKAGLAGLGVMSAMLIAIGVTVGLLNVAFGENKKETLASVDFGIEILEKLAYGIGGLIGQIIGGVLGGISEATLKGVGDGLNGMMDGLIPFLEKVSTVNDSDLDRVHDIAEAIWMFSDAGSIGINLVNVSGSFTKLGEAVTYFTNSVKDIDTSTASQVNYGIGVMKKLAQASNEIPNTGGLLGLLVGNNDMDKWSNQMYNVARGLVRFSDKIGDIDTSVETEAEFGIKIMQDIAKATKDIPNSGGALWLLIGDNDMGKWSDQMPKLAEGLVGFCDGVKDIKNSSQANIAVGIMIGMAEAAKKIPNAGGLIGGLFTNVDSMKDFSDNAGGLGKGITDFVNNTKDVNPNENMDAIFSSLGGMITLANDLSGMSMNAEADIKAFGAMLTGLGVNILRYSNCIDKISDLDKVEQSASVINVLAEMANTVGKTNLKKMDKFGEELVKFGEDSLQSFADLFEKADMKTSGKNVAQGIIDGMEAKRLFFVTAVADIINTIIDTFDASKGTMQSVGAEYAGTFVNGVLNGMKSTSNQAALKQTANYVVQGLSNGISDHQELTVTTTKMAGSIRTNIEDTLEIASPPDWSEEDGKYIPQGLGNGIINGMGDLLGISSDSMNKLKDTIQNGVEKVNKAGIALGNWDNIVASAEKGKEKLKQSLSDNGLWDFSASIGDNLTNAKDKYKEMLGFGDGNILDMFGFGDIQSQFEDAFSNIGDGISAGINNSAYNIGSGGGGSGGSGSVSSSIQNLSDQLALQFHKHFDYEPYVSIGEKIGETMAIASNGAIVDSAEALTETMQEAMDVAAMGIDQWKAWAEARKAYDKLSQNEELAGWKVLQEKYAEGTKERMEADKQVYSLQKSLVSATYNFIKQQIEDGKYYETLTLREEIEMWEQAQELYIEDSEQRKEIDKELYKLKKDLRQQDFEDAKNNLEKLKKINKLSLEEEISEWEKMFEYAVEEEEIRYEIEEKISDLRNQQYQQAKKQIQHLKHMDQLTLGAELASYQALWKYVEEGSDEAIELTEKIYDLQKEINEAQEEYDKSVAEAEENAREDRLNAEKEYADNVRQVEEKLASDIANVQKEYEDAVKSREQALYSTWGLFDEVKDSDYDGTIFMENLEMQVNAFEEWQKEMGILANRGLDKDLIDELTEMGPAALEKIRALNRLTDEQLDKYQQLWKQKTTQAHDQAVDEMKQMALDMAASIQEMNKAAKDELEKLEETFEETMRNIADTLEEKLDELASNLSKKLGGLKDTLKDFGSDVDEELHGKPIGDASGITETSSTTVSINGGTGTITNWSDGSTTVGYTGFGQHSAMNQLGQQAANGIASGLSSGSSKVASSASKVVSAITSTIKSGLGIKSPSKVTKEFGEYTILGFVNGMASKVGQVFGMGSQIINTLNEGMTSTAEHLQTIINDELDFSPVITPVLDISDMENRMTNFDEILSHTPVYGAAWTSRMLDRQNELSFSSKNDDVVEQLRAMREDLSHLGSRIEGMQIMLDTGTLVGEIANPIDSVLGQKASRTNRERGYL